VTVKETDMSIVEQSYLERTRPLRVDALMWVAQHAGILADGYMVSAGDTHDRRPDAPDFSVGCVQVQGEAGSLRSLVARFDATPYLDRDDAFVEWHAYDEGVLIRFIEEPGR
jgi:hypothetical protein